MSGNSKLLQQSLPTQSVTYLYGLENFFGEELVKLEKKKKGKKKRKTRLKNPKANAKSK